MSPHRHLAHVASFYDNPIVFVTCCTDKRRKLVASDAAHLILREVWSRSAKHGGWWVGHYILMPDHVHFFARPAIDALPLARWMKMWKSVTSRRIATALHQLDLASPNLEPALRNLEPACPHAGQGTAATPSSAGVRAPRLQKGDGQIWQADYFDRYLRHADSYSEKWEYVAQNAVRAGLVEREEDWPYKGNIHDLMF